MDKQPFENVVQYLFELTARAEFKTLTDHELVKRYVDHHDNLAFGELIRRYKAMIWYLCWRVLRHHQDVEDAFQATLLTMVRRAKKLLSHMAIEGWIHSTAFKVASNAKIERQRRQAREERSAKMHSEKYESHHCRWELEEVLDKEISHVPEKLRSALILCYLEGIPHYEAAQRLGVSVDALKQRLQRGRECLKKRLSKYGIELSPTMMMSHAVTRGNAPGVPDGLVEKTLEMVRIINLTDTTLEAAGASTQVTMLVKGTMGMTLKLKLLLSSVLLSFVVIGTGAAKYAGIIHFPLGTQRTKETPESGHTTLEETKPSQFPPQLDGYGDPLPTKASARLGSIHLRHAESGLIEEMQGLVAFSHDGKSLFTTAGTKHLLRQWHIASGQLIRLFPTQERPTLIIPSPDGISLATSDSSGVFVWDISTGKLRCQWKNRNRSAYGLKFSPDSKKLTATCRDRCVYSWDVATGKELQTQAVGKMDADAEFIVVSPTGKMLASIIAKNNNPKIVRLWDVAAGKMLYQLPELNQSHFAFRPSSIAFSPDGRFLATASSRGINTNPVGHRTDGAVRLWDVGTGKEVRRIVLDNAGTSCIVFSPDGKLLATGSEGGAVCLWEVSTGKELQRCQGYRAHIVGLAFSSDCTRLASVASGNDQAVRVWDVATGKEITPPIGGHSAAVLSVAFTRDGKTVVSGGRDGRVCLWDIETGRERRPPLLAGDYQAIAALSSDGSTIASIGNVFSPQGESLTQSALSSPTMVSLWDVATGSLKRQFPGHKGCAQSLALSANGKTLLSDYFYWTGVFPGSNVGLWNVVTGEAIRNVNDGGGQLSLSNAVFSPSNNIYAVGLYTGSVSLFDIDTGNRLDQCEPPYGHSGLAMTFSSDGQELATVATLKRKKQSHSAICLWDLGSGKKRVLEMCRSITGHEGLIFALAYSPDGRTIASGGENGMIYLWETVTGKERDHFLGHQGQIWCLAFSPDGRRLASGSSDTTILLWDVTGRLHQGERRLKHNSTRDMQQYWIELASSDARQALQAIRSLVAMPDAAVTLLEKHLVAIPVKKGLEKHIAHLIKQLDDENFQFREKAMRELIVLGEAAEPAIRQALESSASTEVKYRAKQLLTTLQKKKPDEENIRRIRALEVLEQCGAYSARRLLKSLAEGQPTALLTREARAVLARLTRRTVQHH